MNNQSDFFGVLARLKGLRLAICALLIGLSGCAIESVEQPMSQTGPVADAGIDMVVHGKRVIVLSGVNSRDASGELMFHWQQTGGTPVLLSNSRTATVAFLSPVKNGVEEELEFLLTVENEFGGRDRDRVLVVVR